MKKSLILLILALSILDISSLFYVNSLYAHGDDEAPKIEILENNIRIFDTDNVNFLDYVKVSDTSEFWVCVLNNFVTKKPGNRELKIKAEDKNGNISIETINIEVISSEEWNEYVAEKTYNYYYRNVNNNSLLLNKGPADIDAFHLAEEFIGMRGSCDKVAQAFINAYFGEGYSISNVYEVSESEARPGDVIYYANGGLGLQHYAVYLGGSSALHGNINGTTVIGSAYMVHGSAPHYYRLVGLD